MNWDSKQESGDKSWFGVWCCVIVALAVAIFLIATCPTQTTVVKDGETDTVTVTKTDTVTKTKTDTVNQIMKDCHTKKHKKCDPDEKNKGHDEGK